MKIKNKNEKKKKSLDGGRFYLLLGSAISLKHT